MDTPVTINRLPTGVPGLDEVLGGGLPEFSFNVVARPPGCGKTTLAYQIMFAWRRKSDPRSTSLRWASRR
jgi:circadian clock protein KaiC